MSPPPLIYAFAPFSRRGTRPMLLDSVTNSEGTITREANSPLEPQVGAGFDCDRRVGYRLVPEGAATPTTPGPGHWMRLRIL